MNAATTSRDTMVENQRVERAIDVIYRLETFPFGL